MTQPKDETINNKPETLNACHSNIETKVKTSYTVYLDKTFAILFVLDYGLLYIF